MAFVLQQCSYIGDITINGGSVAAIVPPIVTGGVCTALDSQRIVCNGSLSGGGGGGIVAEADPISYHIGETIDLDGQNLIGVNTIRGDNSGASDIIIDFSALGDLRLNSGSSSVNSFLYDTDGTGRAAWTAAPGATASIYVVDNLTPPTPVEIGAGSSRIPRFTGDAVQPNYMVQTDATGNRLSALIPTSSVFRADGSVAGTGTWVINNIIIQGNLSIQSEAFEITGTIEQQQVNDSTIHDLVVTGSLRLNTSVVGGGLLYDDGTGLVTKSATPTAGDILKWTGSAWNPSTQIANLTLGQLTTNLIIGNVKITGGLTLDDLSGNTTHGSTLHIEDSTGRISIKPPCPSGEVLVSTGEGEPVCSAIITAESDPKIGVITPYAIVTGSAPNSTISTTIAPGAAGLPLVSNGPMAYASHQQLDTGGIADAAVSAIKTDFLGDDVIAGRVCATDGAGIIQCNISSVTNFEDDPTITSKAQFALVAGSGSTIAAQIPPSATIGLPLLSNGAGAFASHAELPTAGLENGAVTPVKTSFAGTLLDNRLCEGGAASTFDCDLAAVTAYETDPDALHRADGSNTMEQNILMAGNSITGIAILESASGADLVIQGAGGGDVRLNVGFPVQYGLLYDGVGDGSSRWTSAPSSASPQVPLGTNAAPLTWVDVGAGGSRIARFTADAAVGNAICAANPSGTLVKCTESSSNFLRADGSVAPTADWDFRGFKVDFTDVEIHGTFTLDGNSTALETPFTIFNSTLFTGERITVDEVETGTISATGAVTFGATSLYPPSAGSVWQALGGNGLGGWTNASKIAVNDLMQWDGEEWLPTSVLNGVTINALTSPLIQAAGGLLVLDGTTGTGIRLNTGLITAGSLSYSSSTTGDLAYLTPGTSGYVLLSGGDGAPHTYIDPATLVPDNEDDPEVGATTEFSIAAGTGTTLAAQIAPSATSGYPMVSNGETSFPGFQQLTGTGIAANTITNGNIADATIAGGKLVAETITNSLLAPLSVKEDNIGDGEVSSTKIADGGVLEQDIADDAVTQSKIATQSVGSDEIIDGSVTGLDIASSTITESNIATSFYEESPCSLTIYSSDCVSNGISVSSTGTGAYSYCQWTRVGRAVTLTLAFTIGSNYGVLGGGVSRTCLRTSGNTAPPCIVGGGVYACSAVPITDNANWVNADRLQVHGAINPSSQIFFYTGIDNTGPVGHAFQSSELYRMTIPYNTD